MTATSLFNRLLIAAFVLIICIPGLLALVQPDREISSQEKRKLETLPTMENFTEDFTSATGKFEAYWKDHVGLRDLAVKTSSAIKVMVFGISPNNWALIGSDKWLYYWGPTMNKTSSRSDFMGKRPLSVAKLDRMYLLHRSVNQSLADQGIAYRLYIAPNKQSIYPEHMPYKVRRKAADTQLQNFSDYISTRNSGAFDNLTDDLLQHKADRQLFLKTDTHWNHEGILIAYRSMLAWASEHVADLGSPLPTSALDLRDVLATSGDLGNMTGYPEYFVEDSMDIRVRNKCAKPVDTLPLEQYGFDSNRLAYRYRCDTGNGKLLFISDSFGTYLGPLLSEHFAETVRSNTGSALELMAFIREYQPDVVVDLRVERSMGAFFPRRNRLVNNYLEQRFNAASGSGIDLLAGKQELTCIGCQIEDQVEGISVLSEGNDPHIVLQVPDSLKDLADVTVMLEVESDAADHAALYYTTADQTTFSESHVVKARLNPGVNTVMFRIIPDAQLIDLRLDPGVRPSRYLIRSFAASNLDNL